MVCDMKEIQIRKNDAGQRLDRFVGKAVPLLPESLLQKYIRLKRIKRNGKGTKRDVRLVEGDVLQLYINDEFFEKPTEHNAWLKIATPRLDIVYEDENILLADKKPGVLCHSAGEWSWDTLISNIQAYLRQNGQWDPKAENAFTPALCNRIDRNTGGIVIAAKTAEALRVMNQKIKDREIQIAVLGDGYLPAVEIIPKGAYFDYESKYQAGGAKEICPAELTEEQAKAVGEMALRVHKALGLAVYSRTDMIMDENGQLWCLEANSLPGMTPTSFVPKEAAAVGISYDDLCEEIVRQSLKIKRR